MTDELEIEIKKAAGEIRRRFDQGERELALREFGYWLGKYPKSPILLALGVDLTGPKVGRPRRGTDDRKVSISLDLGEMRRNGIGDEVAVNLICHEQGISKATFERILGPGSRKSAALLIALIELIMPGAKPGHSNRLRFAWRSIIPTPEEMHKRITPYVDRINNGKLKKCDNLEDLGTQRYINAINECENNCLNHNGGVCRRNEITDLEARSKCRCKYIDQLRVEFRRN